MTTQKIDTKDLQERAERIVGLESEVAELAAQAKDIKAQIKDEVEAAAKAGYTAKALKQAVKELRMEPDDRAAQYQLEMELDLYRENLGLFEDGEGKAEAAMRNLKDHVYGEDKPRPRGKHAAANDTDAPALGA